MILSPINAAVFLCLLGRLVVTMRVWQRSVSFSSRRDSTREDQDDFEVWVYDEAGVVFSALLCQGKNNKDSKETCTRILSTFQDAVAVG